MYDVRSSKYIVYLLKYLLSEKLRAYSQLEHLRTCEQTRTISRIVRAYSQLGKFWKSAGLIPIFRVYSPH